LSDTFYEDDLNREIAASYLGLANLIGFDNLESNGNYVNTNYLTFYFPAEVTPEGFNKAFCSVKFQDAVEVLDKVQPSPVWFQYSNADWGWIYNQVFQPTYLSANLLAKALLERQVEDSSFLDNVATSERIREYLSDNQNIFATTISEDQEGQIYFQDESSSEMIASYSLNHLQSISQSANDSSWILPMALALERRQFVVLEEKIISENGSFVESSNPDPISKSSGKKLRPAKSPFKQDQLFSYQTTSRIIHSSKPDFTKEIIDGLRHGEFPVYGNDSLVTRMQSGKFFDGLVIDDLENIKVLDQEDIETSLIVTEVRFDMNGNSTQQIKGLGLIIPGRFVPEGFDRTLGFFRVEDIDEFVSVEDNYPNLPLVTSHIRVIK
jgi:hypothetical protein